MKRPPGLWILLSAGVLWLSLQDVYGIRATALIFGKSSTSTSTTELPADGVSPENNVEETATSTPASSDSNSNSTNNGNSTGNSTGHTLTGIPQIDYVWDPNLPKELNGYNLSEYPFYERVPDEVIEFKCDGLHDGFYASIPHKCQVYHHCLFGTRYDFLCANYTAFDQKTFICQFVSVVDCVNSKKFWHRNDALYQTQSTTTSAPINLKSAIYTTAPPNGDDSTLPRRAQGGGGGGARRRPTRRRRPQFEYYDDEYYDDEEYYEERPRANRGRKRPRPRPRPVYEDEEDYEEYEDERYESRRTNTRRRPSRRRNKDRKKPEYDDDDVEVDEKFEDEDYLPAPKRSKPDDRRKAPEEDDEGSTRKRPSEKRRPSAEKREQSSDRKPPRKSNRRPAYDDEYEDELPQSDDSRSYEDRPRKKQGGQKEETSNDGRPIIKSSTGTIYDRPRVAPRINLPVPKNAADKYAYTTKSLGGSTTTPKPEEEYEDYEETAPKRPTNRRPAKESKKSKNDDSKTQPSGSRPRTRKPEQEEVVEKSTTPPKPKYTQRNRYRPSTTTKKPAPVSQEYEDEEYLDEEVEEQRPILKTEKKTTTTTTTTTTTSTTTTEAPRKEPVMRIIKRPFLPSRGGSPYASRGLQPVGLKAVEKPAPEIESEEYIDSDYAQDEEAKPEEKFKPSPVLIKVPVRPKYTEELIDLEPSRQQTYKARTTQRPKNPLDLNEYDVTLNDALNPTLPNLPIRAFPTGFSSGIDYSNGYQRTRYEPNQNFLYNNKVAKSPQRYEAVPQGQYSTLNAGYRQPQAQTQALYSGY
ncbi:unnamed protein product [Ceutorhynchus assimilis]|uniref:Chitin-binding type-2 domain-containing protein n=1 Tax=Ceutorhynchus assimilis TaxID=467358 RepID=A0A9P0GP54_9CUCU|nr:unnamed protein product [Ceutorhynchus assimilis]